MNKNGLFISVMYNMLFIKLSGFLKLLSTYLNINILSLGKLEPLVRPCPFRQVLRFVNFSYKIVLMYYTLSFNEKCNLTFYISNRVNNNCCASFPLQKKEKLLIFKKGLFVHQKKLTEKFQKTIN